MTVISLTTDFGNVNGFVGTMKGVIWSIAPGVSIADISHDIPAQDIRTGAIALWRSSSYFPEGSVHIAVIDPGVGTARRPIAAQLGNQFFVMPDNGLITPMLEDAEEQGQSVRIIHLDNPKYWLETVYTTFHGRDIFSPCGAHLAAGVPLEKMGTAITNPVRLPLPRPEKTETGYRANILLVDYFGNCSTNLRVKQVPNLAKVAINIAGQTIHGILPSYGHAKVGDLVAITDSEGFVEVAVVNGSAARTYGIKLDDRVEVILNV
jgi:S-adenosylmethionine hydrolase